MPYQTTEMIDSKISELQKGIEELEKKRVPTARMEKQYQLLTSPAMQQFIQHNVSKMEDYMLADKSRETSLTDFLFILQKGLNIGIQIPVELAGKSIAQVLYILDYIQDDEKLDGLEITEEVS